jgi:hypothetical protein
MLTTSNPASVSDVSNVMETEVAPIGAISQVQSASLAYSESPDPSEMVPLASVSKPHDEPHPSQA